MNKITNRPIIISLATAAIGGLLMGCATEKSEDAKDQRVTVAQMSAPARATVERVTAGGRVDQVDKETERGKVCYDVEATIGGKHMEYLIADADGELLGTEVPAEYSDVPEAVRMAAEKYFDSPTGLTAAKGVEFGETYYEIEGKKDGKKKEVSFDPTGKMEK